MCKGGLLFARPMPTAIRSLHVLRPRRRVWRKRQGQHPDIVADMKACRRVLVAAVLACAAIHACAQDRACLVVGVSDGDTLTARCGEPGNYQQVKVRLSGIDAPEKRQAYGERAHQALARLTFQRWARLDCRKTDRYGRSVCNVWVAPDAATNGPKTLDAGLAMITQGMAWWYRAYAREQTPEERGQYEFAEQGRHGRGALACGATPIQPRRGTGGAPGPEVQRVENWLRRSSAPARRWCPGPQAPGHVAGK